MANRVHSKGPFRQDEALAGVAGILPGMLLKLNSAGAVIRHTTEGGVLGDETLIAMEDALQGKNADTAYTNGTRVTYAIPGKGSVFNLLIEDEQDIAIGDKIMSAGNGKLKETTDLESGETLAHVVGVAEEANDLTGSDTADTRSAVRIV